MTNVHMTDWPLSAGMRLPSATKRLRFSAPDGIHQPITGQCSPVFAVALRSAVWPGSCLRGRRFFIAYGNLCSASGTGQPDSLFRVGVTQPGWGHLLRACRRRSVLRIQLTHSGRHGIWQRSSQRLLGSFPKSNAKTLAQRFARCLEVLREDFKPPPISVHVGRCVREGGGSSRNPGGWSYGLVRVRYVGCAQ